MHKESGVVFRAESCLIERHYRDGITAIMQNFGIRSASVIRRHKLAKAEALSTCIATIYDC